MMGMMSQVILNIFDAAMVGRLDDSAVALAATGIGSMAFLVVALTFESLGTGTQILASRRWGEKNPGGASRVLLNSLTLTFPLGLILTLLAIGEAFPLVGYLVTNPQVKQLSITYLKIRFLSLFFFLTITSFRGYFDGVGKTRIRMEYMILVVTLNIFLNYLLIFGKWGFPRLEVAGAALASTLSVTAGALYILICALRDSSLQKHPFLRRDNLRFSVIRQIVHLSFPRGMRMFLTFSAFLVLYKIVGTLPCVVSALAATNILLTILSFSFMPGLGIGIAGATLIGQTLGAHKYSAGFHYGWGAARFGALFMGLVGALFIIFPRFIIFLFTSDRLVVELAFWPLILLGAVQVFNGLGTVLAQCLEGAGAAHWVMWAELFIYWFFLLPLSYFLTISLGWGLVGTWGSVGLTMVVYALVMIAKFNGKSWQKIKV